MIIKKKYTNIKNPSVEIIESEEKKQEEKAEIEINKVSKDTSDLKNNQTAQKIEKPAEKPIEQKAEKQPEEEKKEEKEEKILPPKNELDLSFDDLTFEPRQERREGTRRRGYRRTQDRNIVSRAQQEAISIKEQAKIDGYKEGIEKAEKDISDLRNKFSEFFNYKDEVYQKVSECILDISIEIAKKIIKKEVETDKTNIIKIIKESVEEINNTENKLILKVMPKDVEIVKDNIPEIFKDGASEAKISVVPDNTIKEGGVIIETSNGIINATIESQMLILEKALKNKS